MINIINNEATGNLQPTHTHYTGSESARIEESLDHQRKVRRMRRGGGEVGPPWLVGSNLLNLILSGLMLEIEDTYLEVYRVNFQDSFKDE